jgi:predicted permease
MVIDAALPAAVFNTVLATEFDVEPAGVTAVVIVTTLVSPITLPIFITLFNL